ncbi:50S ribosomal protein L20 [Candidatus Berkelbacteria bacterium CG10_big_fil_rev_8_21_14_0_10_41_12]|uniref:Large ribosomal subunit protein bL20 n=1 Tax=Candidatus Berkelbacteria bacterium CG10_big_fil_rev_8_21_14_0_10_41_12 TaxID=1974513 RepID=A0A2M6WWQ4_9BACT|nr:MAG: 50S ribosomal protein L20 [Candidatus Berkelbacteria bacterium CG10_big_fil_rev_8_21_14_0_10_41_12]
MTRVKRGTVRRAKHKKILSQTKGYRHGRKNLYRQAKQASIKAGLFALRDRRTKKRIARSLWIIRLNAALKAHGLRYNEFISSLKKNKIELNRKVLSEMATRDPKAFEALVKKMESRD